jgi:protein involved in polysaccharide export with SLBB domain
MAIALVMSWGCQATGPANVRQVSQARPWASHEGVHVINGRSYTRPSQAPIEPKHERPSDVPATVINTSSSQVPAVAPPASPSASESDLPMVRPIRPSSELPAIMSAIVDRYVLVPGDQLELVYTPARAQGQEYRLLPGDEIRVEYLHLHGTNGTKAIDASGLAPLDRTLRVQPDGRVALPYLGTMEVAGWTVGELTDELNDRYRRYYVEPLMLVSLTGSGAELRELRESLRSSGSRLVSVAPDGTINLARIGMVNAAGLTIAELQRTLTQRYEESDSRLAVTARLAKSRGAETTAPVNAD